MEYVDQMGTVLRIDGCKGANYNEDIIHRLRRMMSFEVENDTLILFRCKQASSRIGC